MSQQLLNGPYIVSRLQQMCGERVAKAMAAHPFRYVRLTCRLFDGLLQTTFMCMVPPRLPGAWIQRQLRTGKDVLPAPLSDRIEVVGQIRRLMCFETQTRAGIDIGLRPDHIPTVEGLCNTLIMNDFNVAFPESGKRGFTLWSYAIQPSMILTIQCERSGFQEFNLKCYTEILNSLLYRFRLVPE
jgi:hypothetical protein